MRRVQTTSADEMSSSGATGSVARSANAINAKLLGKKEQREVGGGKKSLSDEKQIKFTKAAYHLLIKVLHLNFYEDRIDLRVNNLTKCSSEIFRNMWEPFSLPWLCTCSVHRSQISRERTSDRA